MPLRIVPAHFNAINGQWIACYPFEMKRARGFFVVDGDAWVDFAPTRKEAEGLLHKHSQRIAA